MLNVVRSSSRHVYVKHNSNIGSYHDRIIIGIQANWQALQFNVTWIESIIKNMAFTKTLTLTVRRLSPLNLVVCSIISSWREIKVTKPTTMRWVNEQFSNQAKKKFKLFCFTCLYPHTNFNSVPAEHVYNCTSFNNHSSHPCCSRLQCLLFEWTANAKNCKHHKLEYGIWTQTSFSDWEA